ncbi:MAG: hypothetical protein EOP06_14370 [Proteobacteria bacterium]|nr:MAG: hypothetical protein EOP06_14370 [Pseudomonadota bacterium]
MSKTAGILKLMASRAALTLIPIFIASTAGASFYSNDFNSLLTALKQSQFKTTDLWAYQDPMVGDNEFLLSAKRAPWAGNYFAMYEGGVAQRWQLTEKTGSAQFPQYDDELATKEVAKTMTPEQIDMLSPAEKYDLFVGDYRYSATRHEVNYRGPLKTPKPQEWEGFCNGIRCAGYSLPEPQLPIDVVNPDGIKIRFQPADLKALSGASYFYAQTFSDMGRPSSFNEVAASPPNAAAFDLALRYYLAKKQKAFVIDTFLGSEKWNESVVGYSRKLGARMALTPEEARQFPEAKSKIRIDVILQTMGEIDIPNSNVPTKKAVSEGKHLTPTPIAYTLYLDANGMAKDGQWHHNPNGRGVDYAWFSKGRGKDSEHTPFSENPAMRGTGNKNLDFTTLAKLFRKAQGPKICGKLF